MKEGIDIDEEVKVTGTGEMEIMKLKKEIDSLGISLDTLMLSPDSREVAVHIAGYTAKKFLKSVTKKSRVVTVVKYILLVASTWKIQIMNT